MAALPPEKQNERYFMGLASKACHGYIVRLEDLRQWQALKLIESLKSKLEQVTVKATAPELDLTGEVPF